MLNRVQHDAGSTTPSVILNLFQDSTEQCSQKSFLYVITRSEQRERRGNPEKVFCKYAEVRRTVDLWIATLNILKNEVLFLAPR